MNHKEKVLIAIKSRRDAVDGLSKASEALKQAQVVLQVAESELCRQLKNVFGAGKPVLYGSDVYTAQESEFGKLELSIEQSTIQILTEQANGR